MAHAVHGAEDLWLDPRLWAAWLPLLWQLRIVFRARGVVGVSGACGKVRFNRVCDGGCRGCEIRKHWCLRIHEFRRPGALGNATGAHSLVEECWGP